jgi:4-azaleucine resistance transporter AzlC
MQIADRQLSNLQRHEFLAGVRVQLPILLGVAPFGMIFGVLAIAVGMPPLEAQSFSLFVFAGSSQFVAAGLIGDGAGPLIIVLTIFVVNLRHALYSAAMAPRWRRLPLRWRLALAWVLVDEAFAASSARYQKGDTSQAHWFSLGTGLTLGLTWQLSTAVGIVLGAVIPENLPLDFALPLTFLALIFPMFTDRPTVAAAVSAGLLAVALDSLPYKIGLLVAALVGVGVGLTLEMVQSRGGETKEAVA